MEKTKHFTEVVTANHCRIIIYLIILKEEIKQIFEFLVRIPRDYTRLFVLLDNSLYHLADVFAASCLLILFNQVFVLLYLSIIYLNLVLHDYS